MTKQTYYLSVDIESTGLCPAVNSMISLGAVMLNEAFMEIDSFSANLEELPWPATRNSETMKWWETQPEAWIKATENPEPPGLVMHNFRDFVEKYSNEGRVVFIGYPVTFDFTFVWYYLWYFTGGAPFAHGGMDIKSYAAVAMGVPYSEARKGNWPKRWSNPDLSHPHVAVEDARNQAYSFGAIMRELKEKNPSARLV